MCYSHNVNEDTEQELSLIDFSSTPSQQNGTTLTKEEEDFFSGWEAPERQNAVTQPSTAQANVGGPKAKVNLSTVSHTRVQQKNKPMKLGARRHADFNFEAAQAREKQETVMAEEVAQTAIAQPVSSRLAYADDFNNSRSHDILEVSKVTSNSASVESPKRFGGFGFVPDANTVANTAPLSSRITGMGSRLDVDEHTAARDRFSNAKSISSDQYFQRGQYDSSLGAENNARIAQFQGSNSISSDQYFGRPEFNESSRKPSAEFDAGEVTKKFLRGAARGASKVVNQS